MELIVYKCPKGCNQTLQERTGFDMYCPECDWHGPKEEAIKEEIK